MAGEANVNAVVTVRLASVGDADTIGRIQVETWRAAYAGLLPDEAISSFDMAVRQRLWREWFDQPWPGGVVFVAERDGLVVGFANSGPCREERTAGELYAIYVLPASWGTGTGRALIQRTEERIDSSVRWSVRG